MTNTSKVIFKLKVDPALNNTIKSKRNNVINSAVKMFDYYANEEKRAIKMFDYFTGKLTKQETMNMMLENGKYATEKDIDKRKELYKDYIKDSNLWKCIISFPEDYLEDKINIEYLQKEIMKNVIPKFLKKVGFDDIDKMSYQSSLHTDTDNLHFHFSFIEKEPNYKSNNKIGYRQKLKIDKRDLNFLKVLVLHTIKNEKMFTHILIKLNKEHDEIIKYFSKDEKNYIFKRSKELHLEEKIIKLKELLDNEKFNNKKIKYNSITNKEIRKLTSEIKKELFSKEPLKSEYKKFKSNIEEINKYFNYLYKELNIKDYDNNDLSILKKNKLNNFVLNVIVNYSKNYKNKRIITDKDIIKSIIDSKVKIQNNKELTVSYLKNNKSYINKKEIERAIKNINHEMEKAKEEFSKLFNYEKEIDDILRNL